MSSEAQLKQIRNCWKIIAFGIQTTKHRLFICSKCIRTRTMSNASSLINELNKEKFKPYTTLYQQ